MECVCVCACVGGGREQRLCNAPPEPASQASSTLWRGRTGAGLTSGLGMILSSNLSPGPLPASKSDTQAEALPDQAAVPFPIPQREKPGGRDPVPLTPGMSEHLPETAGKGGSWCRETGEARGPESCEVGQAETDAPGQI